uniref:Metastasis associated 1 family, member 3 n=1 Tax=Cynoglossus semilaevis TaxID=244447 RepID=A0A3P8V9L4_CYNSE
MLTAAVEPKNHCRLQFTLLTNYVYFENSSSNPLLIRRIEELNKTANGNVEAKVVCFYRRRDISSTLIALADKHATLRNCVHMAKQLETSGKESKITFWRKTLSNICGKGQYVLVSAA